MYFKICLLFCLFSCGRLEYSPWSVDVPDTKLNNKNLYLISKQRQEYPFKVALLADPQGHIQDFRKQLELLNSRDDISFTVVLGDLTDYGLKEEFEWVLNASRISNAPILFIPGNHDGLANGKKIYKQMFGEYSYTFNYADHKFVMWNNNKLEWQGEPNWPWLASQLNSKSILMSHIPPTDDVYQSEEIEYWKQLMQDKNIPISIHGHLHKNMFWSDDIKHYVAPASVTSKYGLLTVEKDSTIVETCTKNGCIKE